jgi:CBS domain containing-hemolysin-like protein
MLVCRVAATVIVAALLIRRGVAGAEAIAIAVMSFLLFQVVEVAPRSWVLERPDQVMLLSARPVWLLGRILGPVAGLVVKLNKLFLLVLPGRGLPKSPLTSEEEIMGIIDVAESEEVIETEEREMIHSIFEFGDTVVREVMVPRPDMIGVEADATVDEALEKAIGAGYSRLPAFGEGPDDILGLVYLKDIIRTTRENGTGGQGTLRELVRPAVFVPEQKKVAELLREMQQDKFHMAIVIDEYGGTAGLVTLEDLLEEIVGEIVDEYDVEAPKVERLPDGGLRVAGGTPIDEVNELLEIELPDTDWDTVGGLMFNLLGHVPVEGETVDFQGLEFRAERVQGRRIRTVRITPKESEPAESAAT